METQLHTCYFTKKNPVIITLFGYSTKSIPGLEINGIGKFGKSIKEKIIFITRTRGLKIPLQRFVLNVDISDDLGDLEYQSIKWIEYPLLLHYWFLAGLLPISKLDDCLAVGSLSPSGLVEEPIDERIVELSLRNSFHLISSRNMNIPQGYIDSRDLFGSIANLEFKSKESALNFETL